MTEGEANRMSANWVDAWNSHDLDRIMLHYDDTIEFSSPFVPKLLGDSTGTIRGKAALKAYFSRALEKYPDLRFRIHKTLAGFRSVTVYYESVDNLMAAEVMEVDDEGKVARVLAHYAGK